MVGRRLRVGVLATVIEFGGIDRVLLHLIEHAGAAVDFVLVLFTKQECEGSSFLSAVDRLGVARKTIIVNGSQPKYWNPVKNSFEALSVLRPERVDVIHTHGYRADVIGFAISRWLRVPIVSTCHGFISADRQLGFYNWLDQWLLRWFDRVIAVSDRMRGGLIAKGVSGARIALVRNAVVGGRSGESVGKRKVLRERLAIGEDEFVFGFVGRLSEEKGLWHLVEAATEGHLVEQPWRLLVVGDGPQRGVLEEVVARSGAWK